jgi:calcium-dependent protein kinase
VFECIH